MAQRSSRKTTPPPNSPVAPAAVGSAWAPWVAITAAALLLRLILLFTASGYLYPGDHDDFVRWGLQVADRGLLTLYTEPPARRDMRVYAPTANRWVTYQREVDRVCNYPPLSAYLLGISGVVYAGLSDQPIVNTLTSQCLFNLWSLLADFALAAGCAAIVWRYRARWAALSIYALVLFLPPFWWDSILWPQTDTQVLAPGVWMLYFMLRQQWLAAGVLWGVAMGLKTQGILYLPLWGVALLTVSNVRAMRGPVIGGLLGLITLNVIALPFWLSSGSAWFERAFYENLFETYTERTTLKAFNLWYLDALLFGSIDAQATVLGLSKQRWGQLLLIGGLAGGLAWIIRRWRRPESPYVIGVGAPALLVWAALSMLLIVMLPTKVHERYLILALPFILLIGTFSWRVWPGFLLLTVAMMGQLSWPMWLQAQRGQWFLVEKAQIERYQAAVEEMPPAQRRFAPPLEEFLQESKQLFDQSLRADLPLEWMYTLCALTGALLVAIVLLRLRPTDVPLAAAERAPPAGVRAPPHGVPGD